MNKYSFMIFFVVMLLIHTSFSQKSDFTLLSEIDFHDHQFDKREVKYMFADSKNLFVKYNPVSLSFGYMLYFYQAVISSQFSTKCMHNPSCSEFSFLMIKKYGLLKGIPLSADRLMRCNKLGAIDVPPSKIDFKTGKVIESIDSFKMKDY
ncbi:MAG: membrane protein insertion efficiency factor YidD [Bacteroidota bacterium]